MFCSQCGGKLFDGAKFCPQCGAAVILSTLGLYTPTPQGTLRIITAPTAGPRSASAPYGEPEIIHAQPAAREPAALAPPPSAARTGGEDEPPRGDSVEPVSALRQRFTKNYTRLGLWWIIGVVFGLLCRNFFIQERLAQQWTAWGFAALPQTGALMGLLGSIGASIPCLVTGVRRIALKNSINAGEGPGAARCPGAYILVIGTVIGALIGAAAFVVPRMTPVAVPSWILRYTLP